MYFIIRDCIIIQFRFDPTKHFRAIANPISMPYFSQQPMPSRKMAKHRRVWKPNYKNGKIAKTLLDLTEQDKAEL